LEALLVDGVPGGAIDAQSGGALVFVDDPAENIVAYDVPVNHGRG
jgi:hypothetical protein